MPNILIKEYRGDVVENIHRGRIAVVHATGEVVASIGNVDEPTYLRSANKPIQVIPTLLAGLHEKYGLTEEEVALLNSSHWGSAHHKYALDSIIEKTGLDPDDMVMNPAYPTSATAIAGKLSRGSSLHPMEGPSKLAHCCSGKHLSLMLLQRELTGSVRGYEKPDSPVAKQILDCLSILSQTPSFHIKQGVDGCGVPVYALPLRGMAQAYARLASPYSLPDPIKQTILYNLDCITKHPEKINDYHTPSYYVNGDPDFLMKDGVGGVICMSIKSKKLGIAIKLEDGASDEFQGVIIARLLDELGYDDAKLKESLINSYATRRYNDCSSEIGHFAADFTLDKKED